MNHSIAIEPIRSARKGRRACVRGRKPKVLVSRDMWNALLAALASGWLIAIAGTVRMLNLCY